MPYFLASHIWPVLGLRLKTLCWVWALLLCLTLTTACVSRQKQNKKADLYHQKALSLMKACQYPSALAEFQKAIKLNSKNAVFHHSIALLYSQFKKYDLAIKHIKTALKLDPKMTSARVHLGRFLIEVGQSKEGLKMLNLAKEDLTFRFVERIHIHKGLAYYKKKDFALAEKHFRVARTVQKEDCRSALYHAKSLYHIGEYQKALRVLGSAKGWCQLPPALCAKPTFEPYYFSALSYYKKGQKKEALKDLQVFLLKGQDSPHFEKAKKLNNWWRGS